MKQFLPLLTLLGASAGSVAAEVVVDFGAVSYTTSGAPFGRALINNDSGDFDGDGLADDVRDVIPFSASTPLNPATGWSSTSPSAIFYGGVQVVRFNAASVTPSASFTTTINQNDPVPDRVRVGFNTNTTLGEAIDLVSGVLLWTQPGFLAGLADQPVAFTGAASDGHSVWINALSNAAVRLVIRNGPTTFVSQSTFGGAALSNLLVSLNGARLAAEAWAEWDPATLRFVGGAFATRTFHNLTAVGLYFESSRGGASLLPAGQNFNLTLDGVVLGAGPAPTYALTLAAQNGAIVPDPLQTRYLGGANVTLTAFPASGHIFAGWGNDASGTTNPLSWTMTSDATVSATFLPLASYAGWTIATWGAAAADAPFARPLADPDADQLSNLVEFALGFDPLVATGDDLRPELILDEERFLHLVYERPSGLLGVTYSVDTSEDGSIWTPLLSEPVVLPLAEGRERVLVRDVAPAPSRTDRHFRLSFTLGDDHASLILSGRYLNVLAHEPFDYPLGTALELNGTAAGAWTGSWLRLENSGEPLRIATPTAAPIALARSGGALVQAAPTPGNNQLYRRPLRVEPAEFARDAPLWFSAALGRDSTESSLDLRFNADGSRTSGFGFAVRRGRVHAALGAQLSVLSADLPLDAVVIVIGRLTLQPGGAAEVALWIHPDPTTAPTAPALLVSGTEADAQAPTAWLTLGTTLWKTSFSLDEIRLGDSYEAVTPPSQP